jgi:hypothetical protein
MRLAVGAQAIQSNLVPSHITGLWTFYCFSFLFNKPADRTDHERGLNKRVTGPHPALIGVIGRFWLRLSSGLAVLSLMIELGSGRGAAGEYRPREL